MTIFLPASIVGHPSRLVYLSIQWLAFPRRCTNLTVLIPHTVSECEIHQSHVQRGLINSEFLERMWWESSPNELDNLRTWIPTVFCACFLLHILPVSGSRAWQFQVDVLQLVPKTIAPGCHAFRTQHFAFWICESREPGPLYLSVRIANIGCGES